MSRSSGRSSRRPPRSGEHLTEDERRDIGQSPMQDPAGSPIPGLTGNVLNYETTRQDVPVPEPREQNAGWMAHGVPPGEDTTLERAQSMRGDDFAARRHVLLEEPRERVYPVPVYLVEAAGGDYRSSAPRHITVANSASDATRVCGKRANRNRLLLLNEDGTTDIRIAQRISDLTGGGGAILFHGQTSYLTLETQDELFASTVSATLTVTLSIIEEFDQVY